MNSQNIKISLYPGVWVLKTSLGQLGPRDLSSNKFRTLAPIFINKASFYPNLYVDSMNFTNVKISFHPGVWGLKPSFGLTGLKRLTKL